MGGGSPRNLIDVLRLGEQEVFYASTVAWLLDPRETHGLGRSLLVEFASFVRSHQPALVAALTSETTAVTCQVVRPSRPQVRISAGNARLALVVTTHGAPSSLDRPPPSFTPISVAFNDSCAKSLPNWELGLIYLWLSRAASEAAPRWRHFLTLFREHLGRALDAKGITPAPLSVPPKRGEESRDALALPTDGLETPQTLPSSATAAPAQPGPEAPTPQAPAAAGWAGDLAGGWASGPDSGLTADVGWGEATPSGAGLADQWELQGEEQPSDPLAAAPPSEAPSEASLTSPAILDPTQMMVNPDVTFAGSQTLLDAAGVSDPSGSRGFDDASGSRGFGDASGSRGFGDASGSRTGDTNLDLKATAKRGKRSSPRASSLVRTLTELQKAIGYFRLYPRDHPFCERAIEATVALLEEHHEQFGALEVRIQREGIVLDETLVIAESGELTSLSYLLYPEGIRSLTFERGILAREVYEFVEALSGEEETELSLDHDLLSDLWRRDFSHVQYMTYDQLSPAGLRSVHDPTMRKMAARIREVVALTGSDGADDADLQTLLSGLQPIDPDVSALWPTLPELSQRFCESPAGADRQALRSKVIDVFLGDTLGRSADLVSWANTHEEYSASEKDEANFMAGMVLNALWAGNLTGALDLVARAAGGAHMGSELLARLGSDQFLALLAKCLQAEKESIPAGQLMTRGNRYFSRLDASAIPEIVRACSLQVDPQIRGVFWRFLKTRVETDAGEIARLSTHPNEALVKEALDALVSSRKGRELVKKFAQDREEPRRAELSKNLLGRVTGTFDRDKDLHIVERYPIKKDRVEAIGRLAKDTNPKAFERVSKLVLGKAFAKRDLDEIELTLTTLATMGGARSVRVLQELSQRKGGLFGGGGAAKAVADAAKRALVNMKKKGK